MEKVILEPQAKNSDVLLEYSKEVTLNKGVLISVPFNYQAVFGVDETFVSKIDNCKASPLLKKVGKEYKGRPIRIAFIKKVDLPLFPWGFGEVKVNNPKLNVSYVVGCNGNYTLEIANPLKLMKAFPSNNEVTATMLKDKTKPYVEPLARPVLSSYFVNHDLSIYEIESHLDEIRNDIVTSLTKENIFKDLGLNLKSITVNTVHVPEEELNRVAKELEKLGTRESNQELAKKVDEDDLATIKKEIKNIKNQLKDQDPDLIIDEIDNLRMEILNIFKNLSDHDKSLLEKDINDLNKSVDGLKDSQK